MQPEVENLGTKTIAIVGWLNLDRVPTAAELDPENKIGLNDAYKKRDGVYPDPIPQEVVEKAMKGSAYNKIVLLESQRIGAKILSKPGAITTVTTGGKHVPLFREQVGATAQFLAKLGFEPKPKKNGETFILVGQNEIQTYPTTNPNIKVEVTRSGQYEDSPVSRIKLVFER